MSPSDEAELARLDAVVAENDALGTPRARWRSANALLDKAQLAKRDEGLSSALALYDEVVRRLEGCRDPELRALRIWTLQAVADVQDDLGSFTESRAVAEALIRDHFDDPPVEATDAVRAAALLLGKLRGEAGEAGEPQQAVEVLDRLIARYGRPGVPDHLATAAKANWNAGLALEQAGEVEASIERYQRVIESLSRSDDLLSRQLVAQAMMRQAYRFYEAKRVKEARARWREVLDRFASDADPEIADTVTWARELLDYDKRYLGRSAVLRRRLRRRLPEPRSLDESARAAWQDAHQRPSEGPR